MDWVDQKLGSISLKGPFVDDSNFDGVPEELEYLNIEAVKNAIRRDLQNNRAAPILVVDTLGLTDSEVQSLETSIKEDADPFKKTILLLLQKELKNEKANQIPPFCDRLAMP